MKYKESDDGRANAEEKEDKASFQAPRSLGTATWRGDTGHCERRRRRIGLRSGG